MATNYTVGQGSFWSPRRVKQGDTTLHIVFTPTTLAASDTYDFLYVPAGTFITYLAMQVPDLDTAASPLITLDVGDSGSATRFVSASTAGQAGGSVVATGIPRYYSTKDLLTWKVNAAADTAALLAVRIVVRLQVDPDGSP
jgi:hypothetical protein